MRPRPSSNLFVPISLCTRGRYLGKDKWVHAELLRQQIADPHNENRSESDIACSSLIGMQHHQHRHIHTNLRQPGGM